MPNGPKIDIRQRLAKLTPVGNAFKFKRFNLPDIPIRQARNQAFRQTISDHASRQLDVNARLSEYSQNELNAKLGDVLQSSDPVEDMRQLHEQEMLRIVDLFRQTHDPVVTAEQMAELRQCLVTWAFRLAAEENDANLGLAVGGSAANGVHTFLTDLDFVVMPHAEEDRDAARNVQNMMANLLISIGIDADFVMPQNFNYETTEQLEARYTRMIPESDADKLFKGFLFQASSSFFRFLMDIRMIDSTTPDNGSGADLASFQQRLDQLKDRLIYSAPEHVIEQCLKSYDMTSAEPYQSNDTYLLNIKNDPLRLFHYALYASRAKLGIRESNFWQVLDLLHQQGVISAQERAQAVRSLRLFIGLRHLMGISSPDALDSTKISQAALEQIAERLGETPDHLMQVIQEQRAEMISIARNIFERIGHPVQA